MYFGARVREFAVESTLVLRIQQPTMGGKSVETL